MKKFHLKVALCIKPCVRPFGVFCRASKEKMQFDKSKLELLLALDNKLKIIWHHHIWGIKTATTQNDITLVCYFFSVPDAAPAIIQCIPVSYNNMSITWQPIPVNKRNGIIRGYHIYFKEITEYNWQVYTTPTGNLTSTIVPGLMSYTEYCVKISAFTSKGEYPEWKRASCKKLKSMTRGILCF